MTARTAKNIKSFFSENRPECFVLLLSLLVGILCFLFQSVSVSADSPTYLSCARFLLKSDVIPDVTVYMRTVGYPLLLIVAGFPWLKLNVLLFYQFLMAIGMPVILYKSVFLVTQNVRYALLCAAFMILTLLPFYYCRYIGPDQFYMFMVIYSAYRAIVYFKHQDKKNVILLIVSLIVLNFIRPSANLFFVVCMVFSMVTLRKHYTVWLAGFSSLLGLIVLYSIVFSLSSNPIALLSSSNHQLTRLDKIYNTVLFHTYLKSPSSDGDYGSMLKTAVTSYLQKNASSIKDDGPSSLFGSYSSKPAELSAMLFQHPNVQYFTFIRTHLDAILQEAPSSYRISDTEWIRHYVTEIITQHPSYLVSYIKTYLLSASTSFAGQVLFYHANVPLPLLQPIANPSLFFPLAGEANKTLYDIIQHFLYAYPEVRFVPDGMTAEMPTIKDPAPYLNTVLSHSLNFPKVWFMWNAIGGMMSEPETSSYFMSAALETLLKNKGTAALMYPNNILYFTFGSTSVYYNGSQKIGLLSVIPVSDSPAFFENNHDLVKIIKKKPKIQVGNSLKANFQYVTDVIWTILKICTSVIILLGLIPMVRNDLFKAVLLVLLIWMAHIAVSSIFGEPISRYVVHILPISLLLSSVMLYEIINYLHKIQIREI